MRMTLLAGLMLVGAAACGKTALQPAADGTGAAVSHTASLKLASGTEISATTQRTISSASDRAGDGFTATVSQDVKDSRDRVVIPAGSTLTLSITELQSASNNGDKDGKITVLMNSVTVGGETHPIKADVTSMAYDLKGQGVTAGQVEKTAGGAVIGGVAGRVIGGNAKGTVIGAIVGGVAGAVVASQSVHHDVVVPAGTPMVVTLSEPVTIRSR